MSDEQPLRDWLAARRSRIEALRAEIARQREALSQQEASLDAEEADLVATERTLARRASDQTFQPIAALTASVVERARPEPPKEPRKPKGIPKILVMADTVLAESEALGQPWLEPTQIAEVIRARWWPTVETGFITPQLWRAAKIGKLRKDGTRYARVQRNEKTPAVGTTGAFSANGAGSQPASAGGQTGNVIVPPTSFTQPERR